MKILEYGVGQPNDSYHKENYLLSNQSQHGNIRVEKCMEEETNIKITVFQEILDTVRRRIGYMEVSLWLG